MKTTDLRMANTKLVFESFSGVTIIWRGAFVMKILMLFSKL